MLVVGQRGGGGRGRLGGNVGSDAVTGLRHSPRSGGGGHVGEIWWRGWTALDAHVADQVVDGADLFGGHGAGVRGGGEGGQLGQQPAAGQPPDAAPWLIRPNAMAMIGRCGTRRVRPDSRASNKVDMVEITVVSWLATVSSDSSPSRTCSSDHDVTSCAANPAAADCNACHGSGSPAGRTHVWSLSHASDRFATKT